MIVRSIFISLMNTHKKKKEEGAAGVSRTVSSVRYKSCLSDIS